MLCIRWPWLSHTKVRAGCFVLNVIFISGVPNKQIYTNTCQVRTNVLTWDECILVGNIHVKVCNNFEISVLNLLAS